MNSLDLRPEQVVIVLKTSSGTITIDVPLELLGDVLRPILDQPLDVKTSTKKQQRHARKLLKKMR